MRGIGRFVLLLTQKYLSFTHTATESLNVGIKMQFWFHFGDVKSSVCVSAILKGNLTSSAVNAEYLCVYSYSNEGEEMCLKKTKIIYE